MNKTHQLAQGLASLGRGPDKTLVHMSPGELKGLRSIALASGTDLTINPKTGLPEAGVLDSILPMIAGVAATWLTGGTALAAYGPMMAALAGAGTKAATTGRTDLGTLATGALGGYGGAGIGGALAKAGTAAAPTVASAGGPNGIMEAALGGGGASGTGLPATMGQSMAAGAKAIASEPMKGLPALAKSLTPVQKLGVGTTALDAMSQTGSSGGGGKKSKPTWFMYGDEDTAGFDPETQRYGPATTTQDPNALRAHLLAQSQSKPPGMAAGGDVPSLQDYFDAAAPTTSRFMQGSGDGVSDSIPASIEGQQPAALGDGEFVVDARSVAELGNGSSNAGAKQLYAMVERLSSARKKAGLGEDSGAAGMLPA